MFGNPPNQTNTTLFGDGKGNVSSSLFGQNPTQQQTTSNLFGQNPTQQQTTNNLFGQNPTQQQTTSSLFGQNPTQQQTTNNLFGQNPTQQQTTSSLFGQNPTQQQTTSSLFGQNPTQQQTTSSLFGQNPTNTNSNLFQPQNTLNTNTAQTQNQVNPMQNMQQQNPNQFLHNPMIYSQTKILSLMPSNQLKYEKINYLKSKELKDIIKIVENHFENNRLYLNNFESIFSKIEENFKLLQTESFKIAKFTKLMNSKSSKMKFILDNFNNDIRYQNEILNKNRDNLKIIEHHPSMKITVPSDYLDVMITEIQDFIQSQIDQISDLESLFELNYQKQTGGMQINSDLIEQIVVSFYENLSGLTEETTKIIEKVELIKQKYYIFLQRNLGWKDYEIENKFKQNFNTKKNMDI